MVMLHSEVKAIVVLRKKKNTKIVVLFLRRQQLIVSFPFYFIVYYPQGVSVSQKIDHGSISFGRFELESLSWEKWSVFSDDKRHEEFGKFNGLVAQKKAYFEEYYRKIRELKAQQQNQQTELILEYSGDGSDSSQTGEYTQGAELETPTGSGTIVDDYVEQGAHETTSEQGLTCYDDHENENFNAEFSSSNISSSAVGLQQTGRDARENVHGDDSAGKMDLEQQNAISGHSLGTAYEVVRAPKRIIEKDSRLRYAPKIVPKSVKTSSDSPLDRTSVSKVMNNSVVLTEAAAFVLSKICFYQLLRYHYLSDIID